MKGLNFFVKGFLFLTIMLTINVLTYAQQTPSGDTARINIQKSNPHREKLNIPDKLLNIDDLEGASMFPKFEKFSLYKDYTEEYKKYGLVRPEINLNLNYYNPQKELHPAFYALLIVGAFFNNRITTIQEEQYQRIMHDIYDDTPFSGNSRYQMSQYNLQKGVFGQSKLTISGYKTLIPKMTPYNHPVPGHTSVTE